MAVTEENMALPDEDNRQGAAAGEPWGLAATLAMTGLVGFAIMLVSTLIVYLLYLQKKQGHPELTFKGYSGALKMTDGLLMGSTSVGGTVVALALILFFVWLRKGITVRDYLGLKVPGFGEIGLWSLLLFGFMVANGMIAQQIGQSEEASKFTISLIRDSQYFWLIVLAVVVAAPLLEEFVMRGFLFEGLRQARMTDVIALAGIALVLWALLYGLKNKVPAGFSLLYGTGYIILAAFLLVTLYQLYQRTESGMKFGAVGTVFLTSLFWSLLHSQYSWYNLTVIFFLGLVFGIAKLRTGSLYVPIFLHGVHNGLAVLAVSLALTEKAAGAG